MDAEFNLSTRLGTDLSSRRLGAELRDEARRAIAAGRTVVFDFDGVRTVSDGFADELLAILVEEHGHDWFGSMCDCETFPSGFEARSWKRSRSGWLTLLRRIESGTDGMGSRKLWLWPLYPLQSASGGNIQREVDSEDGKVVAVEIEREPIGNIAGSDRFTANYYVTNGHELGGHRECLSRDDSREPRLGEGRSSTHPRRFFAIHQ